MTLLTYVIVNYNTIDYLRESISSVYLHTSVKPEIIVVDNASVDGSVEMVRNEFPDVNLIASETNLGFGAANNLGVAHAKTPFVILFNSDAILTMDTAQVLVDYLEQHSDVSCVSPRVVLPKTGQIQPKAFGFAPNAKRIFMQSLGLNRIFPKSTFFAGIDGDVRWAEEMEVGWVSGVCMAMRTKDYLAVGGFDTRFFMYCEDIELCMKLSKLGKIVLYDVAEIVHYGGASSKNVSAKVRNSLWQQQHLLMIVRDYFGAFQAILAHSIMLVGMVLRLLFSMLTIPKKGVSSNETLQCAWARLLDLLGVHHALKKAVKS